MKKWYLLYIGAVFLLLFLAFPRMVPAQDLTFTKAYEDYLFKLDVYRKSYSRYTQARDFYLQNETLGLKEDARQKTFEMLVARDDLIAVYLTMIRMKLYEIPDHPGAEKGDILSELPSEIKWFADHKGVYNKESDSLETLFTKSDEVTKQYVTTNRLIYKTISRIAYSRFIDMKIKHEEIYKVALMKVQDKSGNERTLYDRWIRDIDDGFQKITDVENEVKILLAEFMNDDEEPQEIYKTSLSKLVGVQDEFLAINGFLSEMLTALNINE